MTEIHIFLISFFPPNRSDTEWQLCTTEGPTPVFKSFGRGGGRAVDGRNIYFLLSYFSPKHEWHLWKLDAPSCDQQMAPLPEIRVQKGLVFSTTGVDHWSSGPLCCRGFPNRKFYILLFTCSVVRAVHLELVDSMNLRDTVLGQLAVRRFSSRRGLPSVLYTDNAKVFVSMQTELRRWFVPSVSRMEIHTS